VITTDKQYSIKKIVKDVFNTDEELPFKTITKTYPKGTVILKQGENVECNYFLVSGIIELSAKSKEEGQEKIIEFIFPNEFFGMYSFYVSKPTSLYSIICLTECEFEFIPLKEYKTALETSLLVNKLSNYILEYWFVRLVRKTKDMMTKSSEEMYFDLLTTRPEIIKQLSISKIAKYLGIHPDSLSRIRKKL